MQIVLEVQCTDNEAGKDLCNSNTVSQLKQDFVEYITQSDI